MKLAHWMGVVFALICTSTPAFPDASSTDVEPAAAVNEMLFGHDILTRNSARIRRTAAAKTAQDRYHDLVSWVLPSSFHSDVRLVGEFQQTQNDSPSFVYEPFQAIDAQRLVSPTIDLIRAAIAADKPEDLSAKIAALCETEARQTRAKLSLQFMLATAVGDHKTAERAIELMSDLIATKAPHARWNLWPETTAIAFGLQQADIPAGVGQLAEEIYARRIRTSSMQSDPALNLFITAVATASAEARTSQKSSPPAHGRFKHWGACSARTSITEGRRFGPSVWLLKQDSVHKLSGHNHDAICFPAPLTGDFDIHFETTFHQRRENRLTFAGQSVNISWDLEKARAFKNTQSTPFLIVPKLTSPDKWQSRRISIEGEQIRHFVNGREVHQTHLPNGHSPWLSIATDRLSRGSVRNLIITGEPKIPDTVELCSPPIMGDWVAYHVDRSKWITRTDNKGTPTIEGRRRLNLNGTHAESLLYYHRPMMEDGTIEYEFYYAPEVAAVYPALDRNAFLLHSDGVKLHTITRGTHEDSEIAPENQTSLPSPETLPLKEKSWNYVRLKVSGDTLTITLNDVAVIRTDIKKHAARHFGFFHFADRTVARIRNIRWKGDWTAYNRRFKEIAGPPPELADIETACSRLPQQFHHRFQGTTLPTGAFTQVSSAMKPGTDGVTSSVKTTPEDDWDQNGLSVAAVVGGDFDIRASYRDVIVTGPGDGGVLMSLNTSRAFQEFSISRSQQEGNGQKIKTQVVLENPDRSRSYDDQWDTCDARTGVLRLVRIGRQLYFLMSEGDSDVFRLVRKSEVNEHDLNFASVHLAVYAYKKATASGAFTDIEIRAERLSMPTAVR